MGNIVIKVENLSKQYRLGTINHGMLHKDLQSWWARVRGKEDPNEIISSHQPSNVTSINERFWALRDISFDVKHGEILGIIGRNGAGKSTLLKILSRVTAPTNGIVKIKGRVASLLEVGTGFHPELTGRENIYLNGAILGMTKKEIGMRFDEIVDFAEIETFIDTPVKRYSSGMYVRLAFAVAAHLEPDILIVDEVLAVGDIQFQKKCLGKMENVSKTGKTVLFVSHNMGAILQLCSRCLLLNDAHIAYNGNVRKATEKFLQIGRTDKEINACQFIGTLTSQVRFNQIYINGSTSNNQQISPASDIFIKVKGHCLEYLPKFRTSIIIYKDGIRVCTVYDLLIPKPLSEGSFISEVRIPAFVFRPGEYTLALGGHDGGILASGTDWIFGNEVMSFNIREEWSEKNDYGSVGIINVPYSGNRSA